MGKSSGRRRDDEDRQVVKMKCECAREGVAVLLSDVWHSARVKNEV